MLHIENKRVRELLLQGNFGLEKESLRITPDGHLSHTVHPFNADDEHIVRDFCENQTEINTSVHKSAEAVVSELDQINRRIIKRLAELPKPELLWPFSNPPYIMSEDDVPVAQFYGNRVKKTKYRNGLSDKYGRYKMTFSGIHFNYSFAGELLRANYALEKGVSLTKGNETEDYRRYVDALYLHLAQNAMSYGWLIVALTAASPIVDSSFFRYGKTGKSQCLGMSSVRCSELGYWNFFVPVLDYASIKEYADSIQEYVDNRLINAPSELYYPVRLKPRGDNSLDGLRDNGVNHIELRCIDLNPLVSCGIDVRDVKFAQLMLVWLASLPGRDFHADQQVLAVQNYKSAARLDLRTSKVTMPNGDVLPTDDAIRRILLRMTVFYRDIYGETDPATLFEIEELLDFQLSKIDHPAAHNYAWIVRKEYEDSFVKKWIDSTNFIF